MATSEAILAIKVIADSTQAAAGLNDGSKSAGKFGSAVSKMTVPALAAGAAVLAIGKKAIDSASALQQSEGAVEAVFGKNADAVKAYAAEADSSLGLSASAYNQYAALVGTALQNAGFSAKQAVEESNEVMKRGADLSALYGGTTAEAVEAINAAVSRSEFDPLEKYGVSLNMTAVNAELAAKGQDKLTGAALDTAKKAIILEQIYGKSAKAAGQFAREQDSAAGSSQIAAAQWENASAALGTALLPAVSAVAKQLAKLAEFFAKHTTLLHVLLGLILAFAAAILVANVAIKVYTLSTIIAGNATARAWLAALGPIGLVIAAVTAVVLVVRHLWKNSETFRRVVLAVWGAVRKGAKAAANAVRSAFTAAWSKISAAARAVGNVIRAVWNAVRSAVSNVVAGIRSLWSGLVSRIRSMTSGMTSAIRSMWQGIRETVASVISAIKSLWSSGISAIKSAASGLGEILAKPFNAVRSAIDAVKRAIDAVIDAVSGLISKISSIKFPSIPGPLAGLLGRSAPPAPAVPGVRGGLAPRVGGVGAPAVSMGGAGGGGNVVINVTGALDPEAVARQINRILSGHSRRVGLST